MEGAKTVNTTRQLSSWEKTRLKELTTTLKQTSTMSKHTAASQRQDHVHKQAEINAQEPDVVQKSTVITHGLVKLQDNLDRK